MSKKEEEVDYIYQPVDEKQQQRMAIENAIFSKNSPNSIIGKQADLQEVLITTLAGIVIGAAKAKSFTDMKNVFKSAEAPFAKLMTDIEDGSTVLVHTAKGMTTDDVINEAMKSVSEIAEEFKKQG